MHHASQDKNKNERTKARARQAGREGAREREAARARTIEGGRERSREREMFVLIVATQE